MKKKPKLKDIKPVVLPAVPRTALGLRDALFDEINGLRNGTVTTQRARVMAQIAHRVIEATRLEVQCRKMMLDANEPMQLGTVDV